MSPNWDLYNHDCGWLECTIYDCPKGLRDSSDKELRDANLNRDGSWAGLPQCGAQHTYYRQFHCRKRKGHAGRHSDMGYPAGYSSSSEWVTGGPVPDIWLGRRYLEGRDQ